MIFVKPSKNFKLFISKYELKFKNSQKARLEGCLFLFDFGEGLKGYSDFLPWPSYGEKTLKEQLKDIQQEKFSSRFLIAKELAFLDAKARQEKRNLFFSLKIPPSHFLIENLSEFNFSKKILDFKIIKVKLKPFKILEQVKVLKDLSLLLKNIKWRFDLNENSWKDWESHLSFLKDRIDFIEDPKEPIDFAPLAEDWSRQSFSKIKIIKPARDSIVNLSQQASHWKRIIFTHSFDHSLGQVSSAFWAGLFYKYYPQFFETGAFLNFQLETVKGYEIESRGSAFIKPKGFGFGFSQALKNENWQKMDII